MNEWFESKVSHTEINEKGNDKKVKEDYLVEAVNFTDAEATITEKMSEIISGDFEVETCKREKIYEIFTSDSADIWFKVKVQLTTLDETSEKEKKVKVPIYIQSDDIKNVSKDLSGKMEGTISDWKVVSVTETNILDVFFKDK